MDAVTGIIRRYDDFTAYTDDEAIGRALQEAGDDRIELWLDGRKVVAISGREGPPELTITPPPE